MGEPRRWTLEPCPGTNGGPKVRITRDVPLVRVPVEVMPVSEHKATVANMVPADFHGLLAILDQWYPPDVFTGSSDDIGPRLVVLARELERLRAIEKPGG